MSQASRNPPLPPSPNPPAPSAPATEAAERPRRRLDLAKIALFYIHLYQWSYEEQQQMTAAIFAAMRATFLARWAELGLVGIPLPEAAAARLRKEAQQAATQITRTHNAALAQFIGQFVHSYAAQHPETLTSAGGDGGALRAAITQATRAWIEQRSDWKPGQIAGQTTRLGLSLADLYADDGLGSGSALFTVDGPALTANSCPTCRTYYHQVLEQQQAWSLVFPAHPNCEHTLRQLSADERALYELTGALH